MSKDKKIKKHIKMYAQDDFIKRVQETAIEEGMTQSAYIFSIIKAKLNRVKK